MFIDPKNNEIYKVFALILPNTPEQIAIAKAWGDSLNKKGDFSSSKKKSMASTESCSYDEEQYWEPLCGCMSLGVIEVCSSNDEFEDNDEGGGTDCHYEPGGCEEDSDPNEEGGGSNPSGNACPIGKVKAPNNECVEGEKPCEGNPLKKPRIAKQNGKSGIGGGRWGITRYTGASTTPDKTHDALDIENPFGNALFSPFNGNVDGKGYQKDGLGYYVTIRFQKDGVYYLIRFAHLQEGSMPTNGSTVTARQVIGVQGDSGNLKKAINEGSTVSHNHITVFKRIGGGWNHKTDYTSVNPEDFIKTKFNSDGTPITNTDCD